jgi:predicted outer membrane repeat protein
MSKLNILFVSATSEIGGADLALLDVIRRINKGEFAPVVAMPFEGPLIEDFRQAGAEVLLCNTGYIRRYRNPLKLLVNIFRIAASIPGLVAVIKQRKIGLVHSNSSIVFGGAIAAKIAGIRHIWHVREIKSTPKLITGLIKLFICFFSDQVIAISNAVKDSFPHRIFYQKKIRVIYDGVDLEKFYWRDPALQLKSKLGIPAGYKVVADTGLILPLKGYEYFLKSASLIIKDFPRTIFLIIGDTVISRHDRYKDSLRKLCLELGITENVIFTGMRPDIADILSFVDLSVLSSVEPEGLGRVIVESMAMGKPVITTSIGGQAEAVADGIDGLLVPPRDSSKLARAIIDLLSDDATAKRLGEAGCRKTKLIFNLAQNVARLEDVFRGQILSNNIPIKP